MYRTLDRKRDNRLGASLAPELMAEWHDEYEVEDVRFKRTNYGPRIMLNGEPHEIAYCDECDQAVIWLGEAEESCIWCGAPVVI